MQLFYFIVDAIAHCVSPVLIGTTNPLLRKATTIYATTTTKCAQRISWLNNGDQSKPDRRAKAVLVANTLSPTLTIGTALSGKYTSTREPKRIKP